MFGEAINVESLSRRVSYLKVVESVGNNVAIFIYRADLSQLPRHVTKWIIGVLRFMRKYDSSVWGYYGLGHNLGILFAEIMPKTSGSKAAEIRVTRAARDALFATYESIRENPELMATVPAKNRREVNLPPSPNASIPP